MVIIQIIVEDEDGEVVKKYELSQQKPEREGGDLVSQSLKYMGMGSLVKSGGDKPSEAGPSSGDGEGAPATRTPSMPGWIQFGRTAAGEPSQKQRKKSVAEEEEMEDDRHIRFTIGGVGQRMTKEDFIKEMRKYVLQPTSSSLPYLSPTGPQPKHTCTPIAGK